MGRPPRNFEPDGIYLLGNRCAGGRYLLTPSPEVNRIVRSALARYTTCHDVELFAWVVMGNHFHLMARSESLDHSAFMRDFQSYVSGEIQQIREGWNSSVFPKRYSDQKILDDEALRDKIEYIHMNPVQAGLVRRPGVWPGVTSMDLYDSQEGRCESDFLFRRRLEKLRRRADDGEDVDRRKAMETYPLQLAIPPPLDDKPPAEAREIVHRRTVERTREWVDEHRRDRDGFVGERGVRRRDPMDSPDEDPDTPDRMCIATDPEAREAYRQHRRRVTVQYRTAMDKWRNGDTDVTFPPGTCPPGWAEFRSADAELDSDSAAEGSDRPRGDPDADAAA